jgi:hypothetical protein
MCWRQVRAGVLAATSRIRAKLLHLSANDADVIDRESREALTVLADDADGRLTFVARRSRPPRRGGSGSAEWIERHLQLPEGVSALPGSGRRADTVTGFREGDSCSSMVAGTALNSAFCRSANICFLVE